MPNAINFMYTQIEPIFFSSHNLYEHNNNIFTVLCINVQSINQIQALQRRRLKTIAPTCILECPHIYIYTKIHSEIMGKKYFVRSSHVIVVRQACLLVTCVSRLPFVCLSHEILRT